MERSVVEQAATANQLLRKGAIRSKITTLEEACGKYRTIHVLPRSYAVDVRAGEWGLSGVMTAAGSETATHRRIP